LAPLWRLLKKAESLRLSKWRHLMVC